MGHGRFLMKDIVGLGRGLPRPGMRSAIMLVATLIFLILGREISGFYFLAAGTAWASGVWYERASAAKAPGMGEN